MKTPKKPNPPTTAQTDLFAIAAGGGPTEAPGRPPEASGSETGKGTPGGEKAPQGPILREDGGKSGDGESTWCREARGFPVALFGGLPVATTLHVEAEGGAPFVVTTSRAAYARAREGGVPAFVARELVALAHAAQNDRMQRPRFREVIVRKLKSPGFVVTPEHAFLGMPIENADALTWTIGDVFDALGCRLVKVEVAA